MPLQAADESVSAARSQLVPRRIRRNPAFGIINQDDHTLIPSGRSRTGFAGFSGRWREDGITFLVDAIDRAHEELNLSDRCFGDLKNRFGLTLIFIQRMPEEAGPL
jgi:hypothetical protein